MIFMSEYLLVLVEVEVAVAVGVTVGRTARVVV